ncbi:ATPase [Gemmatimonadetes bacterium T265]|nr:ATPase [Gemmatimonadetes bacterium T265]
MRPWLLLPVASLVPALLDAGQMYLKEVTAHRGTVAWNAVAFQGLEWLFLGAVAPITWVIARRVPFSRAQWRAAAAAHLAGAAVLCVVWASLGVVVGRRLDAWMAQGPLDAAYRAWVLTTVPWAFIMYATLLGCVTAFDYAALARERALVAAGLHGQLAEARLDALRAQLHPHFLFNSLNAVGTLVRAHETAAATRTLELLGDLLRHLVRADRPQEVPLRDEARIAAQYLAIEQVRFGDRLAVAWAVAPDVEDALVPDLLLQPLLENAVRHGVGRRAGAGRIAIRAERRAGVLHIAVEDNGAGPATRGEGGGVGLANLRARLHALYGAGGALRLEARPGGQTAAAVTIPLRPATRPVLAGQAERDAGADAS